MAFQQVSAKQTHNLTAFTKRIINKELDFLCYFNIKSQNIFSFLHNTFPFSTEKQMGQICLKTIQSIIMNNDIRLVREDHLYKHYLSKS